MAGLIYEIKHKLAPRPQPPEIAKDRRSRICYAIGEANWVTVDQLSANTYLAALMLYLGFGDGEIGTVMSLSALVCVAQLLTLGMAGRFKGKRAVVTITSLQRLWMAFMYIIPFLPLSSGWKMGLLVVLYFLSRAAISVGGPAASEWVAQITPLRIRGRYLSAKDNTAVGIQAVVLLFAGMVLDANKGDDRLRAFTILGVMVVALCGLGTLAYMLAKDSRNEPNTRPEAQAQPKIWPQVTSCLKNRAFSTVVILDCLWQITYYIACPYNASFSIKEMSLSFTFMSTVGFAGNIVRMIVARRMGAWADKTSMAKVLRWSIIVLGVHYVVWFIMRPGNAYWMYILMAALSACAWSFIGVGLFGVRLALMPEGHRQTQFAVTAAISGVVGFTTSFISGQLLAWLQTLDMQVAGHIVYPQQILNFLGIICTVVMVLYIKLIVERKEKEARAPSQAAQPDAL